MKVSGANASATDGWGASTERPTISQLVGQLEKMDDQFLSAEGVREALESVARVSSWLESRRIAITRRLGQLAAGSRALSTEDVLVSACSITRGEAKREVARLDTLTLLPALEGALADGRVSVAHIDAATRAMAHLGNDERAKVAQRADWMRMVAHHATPDNFHRAVRHAVRHVQSSQGLSQLEQQQKNTWLRHWVDRDSGMVCLRGEFDPESGLRLVGRLQSRLERLLSEGSSAGEPPSRDHVRALAMVAMVDDDGTIGASPISSAYSRAEVCVVVDEQTLRSGLHRQSIVHTGTDIDIPVETLRRIACEAKIIPVVLGADGVVLDMGRGSRLATRNQRRALESMYATCAMPGCAVPVGGCQPHHVVYWQSGGATDLGNLVPLCAHHHRCVHEGGWKLVLDPRSRELTVREPGRNVVRSSVPESVA